MWLGAKVVSKIVDGKECSGAWTLGLDMGALKARRKGNWTTLRTPLYINIANRTRKSPRP